MKPFAIVIYFNIFERLELGLGTGIKPFAMNRFCGAESIKNMRVGSDYQDRNFGESWGTLIEELKIECRAVFVLDPNGKVLHAEYVGEVTNEPDYDAAMEALRSKM